MPVGRHAAAQLQAGFQLAGLAAVILKAQIRVAADLPELGQSRQDLQLARIRQGAFRRIDGTLEMDGNGVVALVNGLEIADQAAELPVPGDIQLLAAGEDAV